MGLHPAEVLRISSVTNSRHKYYAVGLLFIDVQGVFDHLWWPSVLIELQKVNGPGNLYRVICNYFQEWKVALQAFNSSVTKILQRGCPQGSVLGPWAWNMCLNSLIEKLSPINHSQLIVYTGDIAICIHASSHRDLEEKAEIILRTIGDWCPT